MDDNLNTFMGFLESVYSECHTHLLEQGTKRDQVIAFYIVLLSFAVTSGTVLRSTIHAHSLLVIYVGLFVIGVICNLVLADLRSWHRQYLDSIRIINWAFAHRSEFTDTLKLKATLESMTEYKGKQTTLWPWSTTDNMVFTAFAILTTVPVIFGLAGISSLAVGVRVAIYIAVLSVDMAFVFRYLNFKVEQGLGYKTWILSFDYYSPDTVDVFANRYMEIKVHDDIPTVYQKTGGVVTLPTQDGHVVLIRIQRADGHEHWELPRGYMEGSDADHVAAARRELREELNVRDGDVVGAEDLGALSSDSGLIVGDIHVVTVEIGPDWRAELQSDEGIVAVRLVESAEMDRMVRDNVIVDALTIGALGKSRSRR
ncbi:NUDIX hydrolase [Lacticaseibacillus pantheris]|uniref:NUDIX hydrolase n=1 Tax=Lacticaseibacillus pantheris TaxID=171523 RepID=UPI002658D057|nr:NUDIX domain-containing protein [Lacticaseibacillus pantheris]WKF84159.1 NUDIX domain-containing protein [Lacticaseibacillus pantheris]